MSSRQSAILKELLAHLPYSIGSVLFALALVAIPALLIGQADRNAFEAVSETTYHAAHILHLVLSAAATAAMFWGYQRQVVKTVLVSFLGATILCSLSDFAIPYLGGLALRQPVKLHLCIVEHAYLVVPFVCLGVLTGIFACKLVERATVLSHTGHVIVSSLASVLYLSTYAGPQWLPFLPLVSATVFLAVLIPCCLSDIVVPLLFVDGEHIESCLCHHHGHRTETEKMAEPEEAHPPAQ